MHKEDIERLEQPFPPNDPRGPDQQIDDALGLTLESFSGFERLLDASLDEDHLGFNWWDSFKDIGTKRRILVTDHTIQCAHAIRLNARESKIHLLEALDWLEKQSTQDGVSTTFDALDNPSAYKGPARSAYELISGEIARTHTAGVIRSAGSILDCLAALVISALALETDIKRASFPSLRQADGPLGKLRSKASPQEPGAKVQWQAACDILSEIDHSGPEGWLDWTLNYRNMLIHRGRHTEMRVALPSSSVGISPRRWKVYQSQIVKKLLPLDPLQSEVEVFRDAIGSCQLEEPAEETLIGVHEATLLLTERICSILCRVWTSRMATPAMLPQPRRQWEKVSPLTKDESKFRGFKPGSAPAAYVGTFLGNPFMLKRLHAAGLTGGSPDEARAKWDKYD